MLGLANQMKKADFKYFKGLFLKDEHRNDEENKLYLLLRFSGDRLYSKFEEKLRNLPNYVDSYDPDSYHTMFVFDIPGKYSQLSENYKQSIAFFHGYKGREGEAVLDVLYKREQAYLTMEAIINGDLPRSEWTRIPRGQEIGRLLSEIIDGETYHITDTINDSIDHQHLLDDNN